MMGKYVLHYKLKEIIFYKSFVFSFLLLFSGSITLYAQDKALVNTGHSPYAKLKGVNTNDIAWTKGFWADWFHVCEKTMVPDMWHIFDDPEVSHSFRNFEIAAGLEKGEHSGPPFHDGDFYKWFEGLVSVYAINKDPKLDSLMDAIIPVIAKSQREDGYIHSPVVIKQNKSDEKAEFAERLDFETYNMGHLMTAGCLHNRVTGKTSLLEVAKKSADFLYEFYQRASEELAKNAICPSHYMGVTEMYRTTRDKRYLELAQNLIKIRSLVEDGTDHNQDRIPFSAQEHAIGHSVRANYLYAGAADVYLETGDDSLMVPLKKIWQDLVDKKLYITGGCGALYDGVSPNGTSYEPPFIQQVHQAYGRPYQLPNITAHNESCANIGNVLWNWRMLQISADAKYADIMENALYNSILSAVSLDGKGYFYTNPLCVVDELSHELRWSKTREQYISYCNCCPPNTVRTISEIHNYMYSLTDNGLFVNFYGGSTLNTTLANGKTLDMVQETDYPWDGHVKFTIKKASKKPFAISLRIPGWCKNASIQINGEKETAKCASGTYVTLTRKWKKGDVLELSMPMEVKFMASNPLVEETRNHIAVQRGPVVYCLESADLPEGTRIFDVVMPLDTDFKTVPITISNSNMMALEGEVKKSTAPKASKALYYEAGQKTSAVKIRLVPYYAWGNRGKGEMTVWMRAGW